MYGEGWRAPPTDAVLNSISQEFQYNDLVDATGNFSAASRLGEGTYGTVFRGTLRDGTEVAIKALASPKEGGFREEVEVLSRFRHPNLVILMGFARNGRERYLIYEMLPGGDLNARLNKDATFTWHKRLNVVLDASLGLSHLHGSRPQVFHRDVKTQNILMDRYGAGKVADFGLACLAQPNQRSLAVQQTSGTIGYADPLYIRTGVVTEKSEVYSLGMVLLEVLTGRPPALQHPSGRIEYQFEHINGDLGRLAAMVDRRAEWPQVMVERIGRLALQCTCEQESFRPSFVQIVTQLRTWLRDESLTQQPASSGAASQAAQQAQPKHPQGGQQAAAAAQAAHAQAYAAQAQQTPWPQGQAQQHQQKQHQQQKPGTPGQGDRNHQAAQQQQQQQLLQRQQQQQQAAAAAAAGRRPSGQQQQQQPQQQQPGWFQQGLGAIGLAPQPGQPEQAVGPPPSQPDRTDEIAKIVEFGYPKERAIEAFKRCSTVEAAIEWIETNPAAD